MARAFIAGKSGSVTSSEMTAALAVWTANFPRQIFDITSFGNTGWRAKLAGLRDASGSCGGFVTSGTAADTMSIITSSSDTGSSLVLKFNSTNYVTFTGAVISNIRTGADVNDVARVTFDWENADAAAPVVTWVVS